MAQKEERKMILNMVKDNTITVEEGERLFEALEASESKKSKRYLYRADIAKDMKLAPPLAPLEPLTLARPVRAARAYRSRHPRRAARAYRAKISEHLKEEFKNLDLPGLGDDELEELQRRIAEKLGYRLVDHRMELYGVAIKKDG